MSSYPGIKITAECEGAKKFVYIADYGCFSTYTNSVISFSDTTRIELSPEIRPYWVPHGDVLSRAVVTVIALDKKRNIIDSQVIHIEKKKDFYYYHDKAQSTIDPTLRNKIKYDDGIRFAQ